MVYLQGQKTKKIIGTKLEKDIFKPKYYPKMLLDLWFDIIVCSEETLGKDSWTIINALWELFLV